MKTTKNKNLTTTTRKSQTSSLTESLPVQSLRADRIAALYKGCKTNELPNFPSPIWLPIYRLSWDDDGYFYYSYTKGFKDNYEQLKGHIINPDCGFNKLWITKHLDTRISTRIPRRADSMKNYDLLGVGDLKGDYIAYLARSGGKRVGDNYDIFPEVKSDANGYYNFYFPVEGLGSKVKQKDEKVQKIADTVGKSESLVLNLQKEQSYIFCQDVEIGHCPEYIHHLLQSSIYQQHQIQIEQVNHESDTYGGKIIVNLQLKFSSNPWLLREFQPLNHMPV